jgi:hypothetical protein
MSTQDGRETINIEPACRRLGISRNLGYEEARGRGTLAGIPLIKVGTRYLVPTAALDQLLCGERREVKGA